MHKRSPQKFWLHRPPWTLPRQGTSTLAPGLWATLPKLSDMAKANPVVQATIMANLHGPPYTQSDMAVLLFLAKPAPPITPNHFTHRLKLLPMAQASSWGPSYSSSILYRWAVTGEGRWITIICSIASPAGSHFLMIVWNQQQVRILVWFVGLIRQHKNTG